MKRRSADGGTRRKQPGRPGGPKASAIRHSPSAGEWWQSYFDAGYLREYESMFDLVKTRREVARIIELLEMPSGVRLLDCPCGQGRHAHLLAEAGFNVDAVDYSAPLIAKAKERGTGPTLRYRRADMRHLPAAWTARFDVVVNLFTSFGFFDDPRDDARVLREFARMLKPGGVLLWQGGDRDGVMAKFLPRDWWTTADDTLVAQERSFDPLTGFLTVESIWRGRRVHEERTHRIRLYTPTQLAALMLDAGLVVEQAYDSFSNRPVGRRSSEMLLLARKDA